MQPAKDELETAIERATFNKPICPVYQNVDAQAHTCPEEIKANLIQQLTASVLWTKEVQNMITAGATEFVECGPGKALQGMITKISRDVTARGL
jgi:[acyl-carrier-protein] S-malonyltransferase